MDESISGQKSFKVYKKMWLLVLPSKWTGSSPFKGRISPEFFSCYERNEFDHTVVIYVRVQLYCLVIRKSRETSNSTWFWLSCYPVFIAVLPAHYQLAATEFTFSLYRCRPYQEMFDAEEEIRPQDAPAQRIKDGVEIRNIDFSTQKPIPERC